MPKLQLSPRNTQRNAAASKITALFRNTFRREKITKQISEEHTVGQNIKDLSNFAA